MKVNYQERIRETPSELKEIMRQQKNQKKYQKVQALYRLKSRYSLSVPSAAEQMQVSVSSIRRWLKQYQEGGLEKLLSIQPKSGRPKKVAPEIATEIKKQLNRETGGFNSYKEIQMWGKEKYHQEYAYGTVYDLVRQRWQAKLKVPRPSSIKQDLVAKEEFKKKLPKFLKVIHRLEKSENRQQERPIKYWCQDETRLGLKTINGKKITAQGVKAVGAVQWQFEAYYLYGAIAPDTGESFFLEFPYLNGDCFQKHIYRTNFINCWLGLHVYYLWSRFGSRRRYANAS